MSGLACSWERFFLEITNRCNFDCVFCPAGISNRAPHDMESSLVFRVIGWLQALGYDRTLYFHVLGEPLLHPGIFDAVDRAAEAGMRPVLFTNGGALTSSVIRNILASKACELVISMQTINRQSYEMLRKTPIGWHTYLARIQSALAVANDAELNKNGCLFRVSMGVKKPDPEHPEDLYFLDDESVEHVKASIAEIFSQVEKLDLADVFSRLDRNGPSNVAVAQAAEFLSLSVKPMGNWRTVYRDKSVEQGRCDTFGKEMAVLSNGDVIFCHLDYDGRTAIGNVAEKPLPKIIAAPGFVRMTRDFTSGRAVARGCEYCRKVRSVE